jgi:malonyl-CoA O-methyltransferase
MSRDLERSVVVDANAAYALWAPTYPPAAHTPLMRVEERAVRALLPDLAGVSLLDVGCGTGRYLGIARRLGARRLVGVDRSGAMLARVRVRDARLVRGSLESLPVGTGSADVTICALALGHARSLPRAFAELARVTRAGGVLVCSELHPIGVSFGWRRTFTALGRPYTVAHAAHSLEDWLAASAAAGWLLEHVAEPVLQMEDVPPGREGAVDPAVWTAPSALVLRLRRGPPRPEERS